MEDYEPEIVAKILILGDSKVGKSSILTRFTEGFWSPNTVATLGTNKKSKFHIPRY